MLQRAPEWESRDLIPARFLPSLGNCVPLDKSLPSSVNEEVDVPQPLTLVNSFHIILSQSLAATWDLVGQARDTIFTQKM